VPTKFKLTPSPDFELIGGVSEDSKVIKAFDQTFGMDLLWFEKSAKFSQKIKVKSTTTTVKGSVEFMVCDDTQCLPPDELEFSIPVKVEEEKSTKKDTSLVTAPQKDTVIQKSSIDTLPVASVDTASKVQISSQHCLPKSSNKHCG
jgi:thiol:disulfide interchange protein DsbD